MPGQTIQEVPLKGVSAQVAGSQGAKKKGTEKFSYFAVLFYLLMNSMQIRQNTVLSQSKMIAANSSAQQGLNERNAQIKFDKLTDPSKATTGIINQVNEINEQKTAERENIQNALITSRQDAQVLMTQTSTNVNILEQDASENSGWLKTLNTVFQVIDQITQ